MEVRVLPINLNSISNIWATRTFKFHCRFGLYGGWGTFHAFEIDETYERKSYYRFIPLDVSSMTVALFISCIKIAAIWFGVRAFGAVVNLLQKNLLSSSETFSKKFDFQKFIHRYRLS